jgi:hypothetical protein
MNTVYIKTLSPSSEENTGPNYKNQSVKAVKEISVSSSNNRTTRTNTNTATQVQSA